MPNMLQEHIQYGYGLNFSFNDEFSFLILTIKFLSI